MFCSGNKIGSEGALALAESLKQNTTLTNLNLESTSELSGLMFCMRVVILISGMFCLVNEIGYEGALALAESLKQNTTLANLILSCTSESNGHMFACAW